MLIYVPLNRSCGTFSCAFYTYVLLPTSPGIFQCTFYTYVPPATFTATFKLTYSLYVPKTQGNAHEKGNVPHTETFPLSFMYLFFQFCQFFILHVCPLSHCLRLFVPVYPHFLFSYSNVRLKRCSRSCPYFRLSSKLSISRTATSSALRNRL